LFSPIIYCINSAIPEYVVGFKMVSSCSLIMGKCSHSGSCLCTCGFGFVDYLQLALCHSQGRSYIALNFFTYCQVCCYVYLLANWYEFGWVMFKYHMWSMFSVLCDYIALNSSLNGLILVWFERDIPYLLLDIITL